MYSANQRFDNQYIPEDELLTSGNLACAGCGASLSMRLALKGLGKPTVFAVPACCWLDDHTRHLVFLHYGCSPFPLRL